MLVEPPHCLVPQHPKVKCLLLTILHKPDEICVYLKKIYRIVPLTDLDITKRFFEADVIDFLPDKFYLTGTGEVKGLKALYPGVNKKELVQKGNQLVKRIIETTTIIGAIDSISVGGEWKGRIGPVLLYTTALTQPQIASLSTV